MLEKIGLAIGVLGGIGLGLLLGSEFSGRYTTFIGARLILISLISMVIQSLQVKKK
jgi:hypothetical protein